MEEHFKKRKDFGRHLKAARVLKGLTQVQLGKKINRPQSFIYKYETGERRLDMVEFLYLCDILDADVHEIIDKVSKDK